MTQEITKNQTQGDTPNPRLRTKWEGRFFFIPGRSIASKLWHIFCLYFRL